MTLSWPELNNPLASGSNCLYLNRVSFCTIDSKSSPWLWGVLLSALVGVGCQREEVRVYRVAKDPAKSGWPPTAHAHGQPGSRLPRLEYEVPPGWEEVAAGEMRLASFKVQEGSKAADVGVFPLPGLAGGDLGNVNRWRSQVGLSAVTEGELGKLAEEVSVAGSPGRLFDLAGENPGSGEKTRILAGILHREGVAWFFKMTGDDDLVAKNKPRFVEFLKSLRFTSSQGELPPDHPPIDNMGAMAAAASGNASGAGKPAWAVPASWNEVAAGAFLISKFVVNGPNEAQAAVNVSMSPGDGGGLVGNINRWRKQVGLSEMSETEIRGQVAELDTAGGKAAVVEITGSDPKSGKPARILGAIVGQPGRTWFYKLMGDAELVAREREVFIQFVKSARYSNAS